MLLNIAAYHFTPIQHPQDLAAQLQARAQDLGLRGSMLVAGEGINLFLAGTDAAIHGFLDALRVQDGFADLIVKFSRSRRQPFARLKVKVKPEIISFRRDNASPLTGRAPAVLPETLARWLDQGHDDAGKRVVMLDTRNREEFGYGTFNEALTLPIDNFTDLPQALEPHREALSDATVVSFCTGGIRCEKAALWMQAEGMSNVLQLDGGILGYFERVGGRHYDGRCFVFDERVALDPGLQPLIDDAA
ncbi:sulfurtransferase [Lysobacter sp. S4-A87]|uniref:sulfurtransferase n=1 Tax=Lysobacter sp. S4-A87 TaxID=2925843 RepID=UPI001F531332|nr:sulfurtransferase [Lysobacter sp. S4-A87]UNK51238.1 sulfurtransferase [Lysobacter sp. S4-A87]